MALTPPDITFPILTVVANGSVQQLTADTGIHYTNGILSLDNLKSDNTTPATPVRFIVSSSAPADIDHTNGVMLGAGAQYTLPFDLRMRDNSESSPASYIYIKGATGNVIKFVYSKRV